MTVTQTIELTTTSKPIGGDDLFDGVAAQWDRVMHAPVLLADGGQTPDEVISQLMALEQLKVALGDLMKLVEQTRQGFGMEQVGRLGRALFPYYVGTETTKKCHDVGATLRAIELATGGDVSAVNACLSANALKPGECAKVLGGDFGRFFEVTETSKLKESEGKKADAAKLLKASSFAR